MQLVAKGAQDQLVNGTLRLLIFGQCTSATRISRWSIFNLFLKQQTVQLPPSGSLTLRAKVERYAQLVHDCYLVVTLPDIYSPVVPVSGTHPNLNANSDAIGYQFNWIRSLGYNLINYASILVNGQEIVRHTRRMDEVVWQRSNLMEPKRRF